jgi:[ribosomal protein S18]-alanine N-acetyltransferase
MPSGGPADPPDLSPARYSDTTPTRWDAQLDAVELAHLDAESFVPAWTPAVYQGWLEHPYVTCWILRAGASRRGANFAAVAWVVSQRVAEEAEILRLGVRPAWRRLGWGRVLLEGVRERLIAAGATRIFLEVRAGNDAAQTLYRSGGFRETGRRHGYYAEPHEDAVVMAWNAGQPPTALRG